MKITALLFTLAAASARTDGVRGYDVSAANAHAASDHISDEAYADHHLNGAGTGGVADPADDNYDADADLNLIHKDNIRADGQYGSHRHQITRYPTKQPTPKHDAFKGMHNTTKTPSLLNTTGNVNVTAEQTDVATMPTKMPTSYPTKTEEERIGGENKNKHYAAKCTATVQSASNGGDTLAVNFVKPVGWVGAGPGKDFCNIWKCEANSSNVFHSGPKAGHFSRQVRKCSIEKYAGQFCSHTTCTFESINSSVTTKVVKVHSDHREETGGYHKCGFSKYGFQGGLQSNVEGETNEMGAHMNATHDGGDRTATRPACDCLCFGLNDTTSMDPSGANIVPTAISNKYDGLRRQDNTSFTRPLGYVNNTLYSGRDVQGHADDTLSFGDADSFDAQHNTNNFYSSHDHHSQVDQVDSFSNDAHNDNGKQAKTHYVSEGNPHTQYNEKDIDYTGNKVAHLHIDS